MITYKKYLYKINILILSTNVLKWLNEIFKKHAVILTIFKYNFAQHINIQIKLKQL